MQFDDDFGVPFSALAQPISQPTTLFDGDIPAVHFAPVTPIHFGTIAALHGPEFKPVYTSGVVHAHNSHPAPVHPVLGTQLDQVG